MSNKNTLDAREMNILACAFQCVEGPIKVDHAKLAIMLNYSKGSAYNAYNAVRKKLENMSAGAGAASTSTPKSTGKALAKTPLSKGRFTTGLDGADDSDKFVDTIPIKTPSKKGKRAAASDDEADDEKPKAKRARSAKKSVAVKNEEFGDEVEVTVKDEVEEDEGLAGGPVGVAGGEGIMLKD